MVLCGESFAVSVQLPDKYFDHNGCPLWHLINNRFGAQAQWCFDKSIGPVPLDEPKKQPPHRDPDEFNYYRDLHSRLFLTNPRLAEQIQNSPLPLIAKIELLEKETVR